MSRYTDFSNPRTIKRLKAEGRGTGEGENYTPWILTHDFSSLGKSHRIKGWKTSRTHHLFSDRERDYFLMAEWSPIVVDIREQFPLDLTKTLAIADALGLRHHSKKIGSPIVPTTDFLLTLNTGQHIARSIKTLQDTSSERVWEKFRIEQRYWADEGVDYGMITEAQICKPLARNMLWLHKFRNLADYGIEASDARQIANYLRPLVLAAGTPLNRLALDADEWLGFTEGTCLAVVKYLIANRRWAVDLSVAINPSEPLTLMPPYGLSDSPEGSNVSPIDQCLTERPIITD